MAEDTKRTKVGRKWLRMGGLVLGIGLVLLVALYFAVTSEAFFKSVILPRAGAAMNAEVTVAGATIKPFSRVTLRDVKVQPTGHEPLFTAGEVDLRYNLRAILGGNIKVSEVTVSTPVIHVVELADGSSNLDPLLKAEPKEEKPAEPSKPSEPPRVDIGKVTIQDAALRLTRQHANGQRDLTELKNVNVALTNLKNGEQGELKMDGALTLENAGTEAAPGGTLMAKLAANFKLALTDDLAPSTLNGNASVTVNQAAGSFAELAAAQLYLTCAVTPANVEEVALQFKKADKMLGQIYIAGPFDLSKQEGRLKLELRSLDRNVLNLAGAPLGLDFGQTSIQSTNEIELAQAGSVVQLRGALDMSRFAVTMEQQTTPVVDLRAQYDLKVDQGKKSALLQTLQVNGTQNQKPLLRVELTQPMTIALGESTADIPDSNLRVSVTDLNLRDWRAFAPDADPAGMVNLTLNAGTRQGGKQLSLDLKSSVAGLSARMGTNSISPVDVALQMRGQANEFKQFRFDEYQFRLTEQNQPALTVDGLGEYNLENGNAELQVNVSAQLVRLLSLLNQPDISASAGTLTLNGRVAKLQQTNTVTGLFTLGNFTGRFGEYDFRDYGVTAELDIALENQLLRFRQASGGITSGTRPGGRFAINGSFDLEQKLGDVKLTLVNLNELALRPILEPLLGEKKLASVTINSSASVNVPAPESGAVKGEFHVTNLVVQDPKGTVPATPLELKATMDVSKEKETIDITTLRLNLTPTARAKNEVTVSGKINQPTTNVYQGEVQLVADSLDLTTYYNLFADQPTQAAPPEPAPTPALAPSPAPPAEPEPIELPFRNFTATADIGRLYLRELEITNLQTKVVLNSDQVVVRPFQFVFNGAPAKATADVNLGVPGWRYDISFSADRIPVAPLANSFSPQYRGQAQGDLLANVQIKVAGVTGASLQKNLSGQLGLTFTNANIQIVSPKWRPFVTVVALALKLDPNDLLQSPVNWLTTDIVLGGGNIQVNNLRLQSTAFIAGAKGTIPIASTLMESPLPDLPVSIALRRSLAEKARVMPPDAPTNAAYIELPVFVTAKGTLGNPKADIKELVLAGMTARSFDLPGKIGGDAGKVLDSVLGGVLGTQQSGGSTNKGTNPPPAFNPFDLLKKPKKEETKP